MDVQAPQPAVAAVARLLAWKLPLHGSPVTGRITVASGGGALTQWKYGTNVTLERICGHRDVDSTDCPGTQCYAQLPALRALTASEAQPIAVNPTVSLGGPPAVAFGGQARFTGVLTDAAKAPLAGQAVRIEKQAPGGGWKAIARGVTGADGGFALSAAWTRPGLARAVALQVTSLPVDVGIIPAVTAQAGAAQVARGGVVTVSGAVRPAGTIAVVVERRSAGRWRRIGVVGGEEERHPTIGGCVVTQDPRGGVQDPRALVGVRVQHDEGQVERRRPLGHRAGLPTERGQDEVGGDVGCHGAERSAASFLRAHSSRKPFPRMRRLA